MKYVLVTLALALAAPAAAQTAPDAHQGHGQHQQQGHQQHQQHQPGQTQGHGDGCCADRNGNGRMDCCERMAGQSGDGCACCETMSQAGQRQPAPAQPQGHQNH